MSVLQRYGLATVCCGIAAAVALRIDAPASCFILAVTLSNIFGGLGPGLWSVGLSLLLFQYFFLTSAFTNLPYLRSIALLTATLLITVSVEMKRRAEESRKRAVKHASEEIGDLTSRLVGLQDAERRRLATELHDIVGQNLSTLATELALIRNRLPVGAQPELCKSLADATLLAKQSVEAVRNVMAQLRPPGLDELGLPAALRWHASAFEFRTGIATKVDAEEPLLRPRAAVEDAVLRIYLEALTNVAKHAAAHAVLVKLELCNGYLRLSIADDGRGFDVQAYVRGETPRCGIAIMRERAAAIGAELQIRSAPGAGTVVEFRVSKDKWS